jgi:hypothetical protein
LREFFFIDSAPSEEQAPCYTILASGPNFGAHFTTRSRIRVLRCLVSPLFGETWVSDFGRLGVAAA